MIDLSLAASRPLATASKVIGGSITEEAVFSKHVVLIAEADALNTNNGKWCFTDSIRLLARIVGRLTIVLPPDFADFEQEVRELAENVCFREKPSFFVGCIHDVAQPIDAVLNIGSDSNRNFPWTSVNSNGWIARVCSVDKPLPKAMSEANPIAALLAASFGVSEIFKRIVGIPNEIAPLLELEEFSLFELSSVFQDSGPALPQNINLPYTAVFGAGAIGNGVALLQSQLPLSGAVHFVDKQKYADENLGTCVLTEKLGWIGYDKAERLAKWLAENSSLTVTGERSTISDATGKAPLNSRPPKIVINGLDDVHARHDAQLLWPDFIVDGGISDVAAAVVQHRLDDRQLACMRCNFEIKNQDHIALQKSLTGLTSEVLSDPERTLNEKDISLAEPEKRDWLREQMAQGKTICSVVSEASLRNLGVNAEAGFRPSVPFVATAAAALVIGEMVKGILFPSHTYFQNFTLGSLLLGFENSTKVNRSASSSCLCVSCKSSILAWRNREESHSD